MKRIHLGIALLAILVADAPTLAADAESEVAALEQQCEAAREAKLKPMRDAEIARCKEQGKDPGYCERFFRDLGNAVTRLPNGNRRPRLFDDLPECVLAFEARKKLNLEAK